MLLLKTLCKVKEREHSSDCCPDVGLRRSEVVGLKLAQLQCPRLISDFLRRDNGLDDLLRFLLIEQ